MGCGGSKQANDAVARDFFGDGASTRHIQQEQHDPSSQQQQQQQQQQSPSGSSGGGGGACGNGNKNKNKQRIDPETSKPPPNLVASPPTPPLNTNAQQRRTPQPPKGTRTTPSETVAAQTNTNKNRTPQQQQQKQQQQQQVGAAATTAAETTSAAAQMKSPQNQQRHHQKNHQPTKPSSTKTPFIPPVASTSFLVPPANVVGSPIAMVSSPKPSHAPVLDAATNKPKQPPRQLDEDDFSVAPSLDVEVRSITKTTFDDIYIRGKKVRATWKTEDEIGKLQGIGPNKGVLSSLCPHLT